MRVLTLEEFCKEPNGTVFSEFNGDPMDAILQVKTGYYEWQNKPTFNGVEYVAPIYASIDGNYFDSPRDLSLDNVTETFSVDTAECDYEEGDKFIVYNNNEIAEMINVLKQGFR